MRFFIALLALLLPAQTLQAAPEMRPGLWQVSDDDTTIWLFGTIHMLDPGRDWFNGPARAAFDTADELVLEADISDSAAAQTFILGRAIDPSGKPLGDRVPTEIRQRLSDEILRLGLSPTAFDRVKPWYAALALEAMAWRNSGLDAENGVESILTKAARTSGKTITGLETVEAQINLLDTMPHEVQVNLLAASLGSIDANSAAERTALVASWGRGDVDMLARLINTEMKDMPELRAILLDRRNASWSGWIRARLDQPGKIFVAVGAGHLGGPGNLLARLEASGLVIRRIR